MPPTLRRCSVLLLLCFLVAPASAVHLALDSVASDTAERIDVAMRLQSEGATVGGVQSDILFDHRALRLPNAQACRITPALGTGMPACNGTNIVGPCKSLITNLVDCGATPQAPGCDGVAPSISRLRWILAATAVPNNNEIPDGSTLFTCTFEIVDAAALPALLLNQTMVGSNPFGVRLPTTAGNGAVLAYPGQNIPPTWTPPPSPSPISTSTARPTSTPRPSSTPVPTRTATATFSPSATQSPRLPQGDGATCSAANECTLGYCVDRTCCAVDSCTADHSCAVSETRGTCAPRRSLNDSCQQHRDCASLHCQPVGHLGICSEPPAPSDELNEPPPFLGPRLTNRISPITEQGTVVVEFQLAAADIDVGGLQVDLTYDVDVLRLPNAAACKIHPAIGDRVANCEADGPDLVEPCKTLSRNLTKCGDNPLAPGCEGQPATWHRFRGIIAATAVPNNNAIPSGPVLTCTFEMIDPTRLPYSVVVANAVASTPYGTKLEFVADGLLITGFPEPTELALGSPCKGDAQCTSGHCTTGVCCEQATCAAGLRCDRSHNAGGCTAPLLAGACLKGSDCATAHCTLTADGNDGTCRTQLGSDGEDEPTPFSQQTPTASPQSTPVPQPAAYPCVDSLQCTSGNCVDGMCCSTAFCPPNQYCNIAGSIGRCAPRQALAVGCNQDNDCQSNNCDLNNPMRPIGVAGICGSLRTPTPSSGNPPCSADEHCQPGFFCNEHEGFLCCDAKQCPLGQTCRDPRNPGFCTNLPTPTPTRVPNPAACSSSDPSICASGFCVNSTCCSTASCPTNERCDILGYAGNCAPALHEGWPCAKHLDCEGILQCRDIDGSGFLQCVVPFRSPTSIPPLAPTKSSASITDDDGCSISPQPASTGVLWLVLGAAVLWVCARSQRARQA